MSLVENMQTRPDNDGFNTGVFVDLVDHSILIHNLEHYGLEVFLRNG